MQLLHLSIRRGSIKIHRPWCFHYFIQSLSNGSQRRWKVRPPSFTRVAIHLRITRLSTVSTNLEVWTVTDTDRPKSHQSESKLRGRVERGNFAGENIIEVRGQTRHSCNSTQSTAVRSLDVDNREMREIKRRKHEFNLFQTRFANVCKFMTTIEKEGE